MGDHFLSLKMKNICSQYKIWHPPPFLFSKHLISCISLRYEKTVGWNRPVLRRAATRTKIDYRKLEKNRKKYISRTKKIKKNKNFKYFFKRIAKAAKRYGGINVGTVQFY